MADKVIVENSEVSSEATNRIFENIKDADDIQSHYDDMSLTELLKLCYGDEWEDHL